MTKLKGIALEALLIALAYIAFAVVKLAVQLTLRVGRKIFSR